MPREREFLAAADRALLSREFRIDDPERLTGLLDRLPDDAEVAEILGHYDVTPKGGRAFGNRAFVHCAHCHGARHWRGYAIKLTDSRLALVGVDCGEKQFGLDFKTLENAFQSDQARKSALERLLSAKELLPALLAELDALSVAPVVSQFDNYLSDLRLQYRKFVQAIARTGGQLTVTRFRRNLTAEEDRAKRQAPELFGNIERAQTKGIREAAQHRLKKYLEQQPPILEPHEEAFGTFAGVSALTAKQTPSVLVTEALALARHTSRELTQNSTASWKGTTAFTKTMRSIADAVAKMDAALHLIHELAVFTSSENLRTLAAWSEVEAEQWPNARIERPLRADGRSLIDDETGCVVVPSHEFQVPKTGRLEQLRDLVGITL